MTIEDRVKIKVIIKGRVQGVWYRGWTIQEARGLGLDGWVRNCRDGTVEAVFAGPRTAVVEILHRCRSGPPAARVDAVVDMPFDDDVQPGFRPLKTVR